MSEQDLEQLVFGLLKIGAIVVVIFNTGIALINLRQISIMNNIINVTYRALMIMMILGYLGLCIVVLLYIVLS